MSGRSMALDVLVRLRDNLSGPLRRLRNNLRGLTNFARRIGVLGVAIGALSFLGPIQEAAAFQQKLLDIAGTAELSGKAAFAFVDVAGDQYEALAFKVGQYSDTIAAGAGQMIAAGISRDLIDASIGDIGAAATAANAEFSDMALVATSMLQTLKVPASDIRDTMGALVIAGKEGAFELKDMAAHFPRLTASVAKFGIKGREAVNFLASALQIARKGTADPASAANNLSNFLQKALSPLTKKNFKKMGVDIEAVMKDAAAKGINPIEAMLQKIGKLTGADQNTIAKYMKEATARGLEGEEALGHVREQLEAIGAAGKITELFQDQQVLDFLIPFMANVQEYKDIKEKVAAATGAAIDADFETQMEGINRQLLTFREIGKQAIRQVGFAFAEWLPDINAGLMTALSWMRDLDKQTGGWVKTILVAGGGVLIAVAALGALGLVLPIVGAGFGALAALAGVLLSPLGLVIGLLAAGGALIWKNWDRFGPRLTRLWNRVKTAFERFGRSFSDQGRRVMDAGRQLADRYGPMVGDALVRAFDASLIAAENFKTGFGTKTADIARSWSDMVEQLKGTGSEIKGLMDEISRDMNGEGVDAKSLGEWAGGEVSKFLRDLKQLLSEIKAVVAFIRETRNDGLEKSLDNTSFGQWWQGVKDQGNAMMGLKPGEIPIEVFAARFKASMESMRTDIRGLSDLNIDWAALLPDSVIDAWDSFAPAINRVREALRSIKGAFSIEGLLPGTTREKNATALGSKMGDLANAPKQDRATAAGDLMGRMVQPAQKPVRLDGNVNVRISVDGQGKVVGANSDNASIKVDGGRVVGRQ